MNFFLFILNSLFQVLNITTYWRFIKSTKNVDQAQGKVLERILSKNKNCEIGKKYNFKTIKNASDFQCRLPLANYSTYETSIQRIENGESNILCSGEVNYLALSSGSSAASKLIPYTKRLKKEFSRAINAWLYDLLRHYPEIKYGSQFWIITPASSIKKRDSKVPVGFESDSNYFGTIERILVKKITACPDILKKVQGNQNYFYLLCYFLIQKPDLRFISVWNPSLLVSICHFLKNNILSLSNDLHNKTLSLPNPKMGKDKKLFRDYIKQDKKLAVRLRNIFKEQEVNFCKIWPGLQLISCWTDSWSKDFISDVQKLFPGIPIQGKGLLATEGAVSIPLTGVKYPVLTPNAHFYEFKDIDNNRVLLAHQLKLDSCYKLYITTSGGFYRYALNDIVKVRGFYNEAPMLQFIGKTDNVSDFVGEKLNEVHVTQIIAEISKKYLLKAAHTFIGISKLENTFVYMLYIVKDSLKCNADKNKLVKDLDNLLSENYHYHHCRQMKQLKHAGLNILSKDQMNLYINIKSKKEVKSTFKFSPLEKDFELLQELKNNSG